MTASNSPQSTHAAGPKFKFENNIHKIERGVRIVVGLGLVSLAFVGPANPWFFLGAIPLFTGLIGWCPLYSLLRINTCPVKRA
jgi:hypothetical protein